MGRRAPPSIQRAPCAGTLSNLSDSRSWNARSGSDSRSWNAGSGSWSAGGSGGGKSAGGRRRQNACIAAGWLFKPALCDGCHHPSAASIEVAAENATGGHACKTGDDNVNKGPLQNDTPDEWLFLNETNMENSKKMAPNKISNCRKAG